MRNKLHENLLIHLLLEIKGIYDGWVWSYITSMWQIVNSDRSQRDLTLYNECLTSSAYPCIIQHLCTANKMIRSLLHNSVTHLFKRF